jgi:hypothetical protein
MIAETFGFAHVAGGLLLDVRAAYRYVPAV